MDTEVGAAYLRSYILHLEGGRRRCHVRHLASGTMLTDVGVADARGVRGTHWGAGGASGSRQKDTQIDTYARLHIRPPIQRRNRGMDR